jgi:DNA-directed RNA polymerase subunit K/omega
MDNIIIALIAAIGGGGLASIITAVANRRKTSAEATQTLTKTITDATKELLSEYRQLNDDLQGDLEDLRTQVKLLQAELKETKAQYRQEQALQDKLIEATNAKVLKLELIHVINARQMRATGIEPLVAPGRVDSITLQELRDIAEGLANIENRREGIRRGSDD